ncbi:MAG TPA: protein kinase [Bryobacteraceae bacterium]|nr:protein kinase [Bryobacteraceae bacterium]
MIGESLGHYRILEKIGAGGMGVVYRARDERLERDVAIKVLPAGMLSDENARKRFRKEALALSHLNHPNIATIHDFDSDSGVDFLVLEHIPGVTLDQKISRGPLPEREVLDLGMQLAAGLSAAHEQGVVHRDLKPGNLRVTPDGRLKILDFGLAVLRKDDASTVTAGETGKVAGTLAYMAPEQLRGQAADARSDIYAAGVVLYEACAGRRAFPQKTSAELVTAIVKDEPAALSGISAGLERAVSKCLQKDPGLRYWSMRELGAELGRIAAPPPAQGRPRRRAVAIGGGLVVLLAAVAGFWMMRRPAAAHPLRSLAVLPLENFTGDAAQAYFADGMTEELTSNLAKIGALRVISRTSVMQYKGQHKPMPEIARELNVDAVIEGSVQRAGDRVRITAQLIDAAADRHLWSESYDRDLTNVLALQSEVARAIAEEVRAQLTPQEKGRLARSGPVKPEAYDLYLRGKVAQNNRAAIDLLQRAVNADPGFADAHAELAMAYCQRIFSIAPEEQKELEPKAWSEVEKALAIDPDLANAYSARGQLLWSPAHHFPHEEAIREFRRALVLNPNSDEAHAELAMVYNHVGLLEESLDHAQQAAAINPGSPGGRIMMILALLPLHGYERAIQLTSDIPGLFGQTLRATILAASGKEAEARAELDKLPPNYDTGGMISALRAVLYAAGGEQAKAEEKIKIAVRYKEFGHFHHTAMEIATAYALMRKPDQAIQWLEQTADTGYPCYPAFANNPSLDSLRQDPRFIALLDRLKQQMERYKALAAER